VSGEVLALTLTVAVHLIGAGLLIGLLFTGEETDWRSWWPRDDDGRGPRRPEGPPELPMPGAAPSQARLREQGGRIAGAYARPERRPAREPEPQREPAPR
jgi:hypothetical protein